MKAVVIDGVRIHQQDRRSMVMKLTPVGVVVFIPRRMKPDSAAVKAFIAEGLKQLQVAPAPAPAANVQSEADLRATLAEWAARLGVQPQRVQVRDMYRKWGSCSTRGNITLNRALCRVPRPLAEYVVVHELVHLRVFNHGKDFKAMMSAHMPDWKAREAALQALLRGAACDTSAQPDA